jgi:urate oxidase
MTEIYLKSNRYGKQQVKFLKKIADKDNPKKHEVIEYTVMILLTGGFTESYTKEDNASVIPTDTQKNTIYLLAKTHDFTQPEVFAAIVANHFTSHERFAHVSGAHCEVVQHRWTRVTLSTGEHHPHSFFRDGEELRTAVCDSTRGGSFLVRSGIKDLLVLKSTGSAFYGFFKDEWTTLPEVKDRIFSTSVDCTCTWAPFGTLSKIKSYSEIFSKAYNSTRQITFDIFAKDFSASVQATMYKMCSQIIQEYSGVAEVEYVLPNKHYFETNMEPFGIKNSGPDATVYMPQAWPAGRIQACVARKSHSKL